MNAKTKLAAGATVVGLGGLAGLALGSNPARSPQAVADKPLVHTKVIRRTVHVTKHAKPKHPLAGPGGAGSPPGYAAPVAEAPVASATTGSSSSGSATEYAAEPVTTSTSGAAAEAPSSGSEPVTTSTSGAAAEAPSSGSEPVTTATSGGGSATGGSHGDDGGEHEGGDD